MRFDAKITVQSGIFEGNVDLASVVPVLYGDAFVVRRSCICDVGEEIDVVEAKIEGSSAAGSVNVAINDHVAWERVDRLLLLL